MSVTSGGGVDGAPGPEDASPSGSTGKNKHGKLPPLSSGSVGTTSTGSLIVQPPSEKDRILPPVSLKRPPMQNLIMDQSHDSLSSLSHPHSPVPLMDGDDNFVSSSQPNSPTPALSLSNNAAPMSGTGGSSPDDTYPHHTATTNQTGGGGGGGGTSRSSSSLSSRSSRSSNSNGGAARTHPANSNSGDTRAGLGGSVNGDEKEEESKDAFMSTKSTPRRPQRYELGKGPTLVKILPYTHDDEAAEKLRERQNEMFTWDLMFVFKVGGEEQPMILDILKRGRDMIRKGMDKIMMKKQEGPQLTEKEMFKQSTAMLVQKLQAAGLKTDLYYSKSKNEIMCRVGATEARLIKEADRTSYDLMMDKDKCLQIGNMLGLKLAHYTKKAEGDLDENAWKNLYGMYDGYDPEHPHRQDLYVRWNTEDETHNRYNSFFSPVDRVRLTWSIIEADETLGGAALSIGKTIEDVQHGLDAVFPLHEHLEMEKLKKEWFNLKCTFYPPLKPIRYYFGEKVAFYFAFLAYYNYALLYPAAVGTGMFIWQMVEGRVDVDGFALFALFMSLWGTLFLEFWRRFESKYRIEWGMCKFDEKEQPRPEFSGEWKISPIDGKKYEYFSPQQKLLRAMLSQTVIWTLILVVIASVIAVFLIRTALQGDFGTYATAVITAIQIQVLNIVYSTISKKLNDYENHRTDTEYENALIAKSFLFKFVNSYNSLFYIAWFKKYDKTVNGCTDNDCLTELQKQLGTIFVSLIILNNLIEVGVPFLRAHKAKILMQDVGPRSVPEMEFEMEEYESTFDDFDEIVIQYGYVTMFVVAFPLAPMLALANNVLETRIDSSKLCVMTRRPEPKGASNIGKWYDILNIVGFVSVITNCALIAFASPKVSSWFNNDHAWLAYAFIIAEHGIFILKFAIAYFMPDEPEDYHIHIARQEYLVNVLINGMKEEDEESLFEVDVLKEKANHFNWDVVADDIKETGHEWDAGEWKRL